MNESNQAMFCKDDLKGGSRYDQQVVRARCQFGFAVPDGKAGVLLMMCIRFISTQRCVQCYLTCTTQCDWLQSGNGSH